jgi:NAD(P)-dependent dehydrogenase (short-subunit alcohol dehydrogenase family)
MVDVMSTIAARRRQKLADRVAIVTGAANGIGRAIADAFVREGCRVAAVDIDAEGLRRLAAAHGEQVLPLVADGVQAVSATATVATVVDTWGGIDILVNNIGGRIGGAGLDVPETEWLATLSLSLTSHFLWSQAAAPAMIARKAGRIINIASNAGRFRSNTGTSGLSYSAAKGGVLQLTRTTAHLLGRFGINVNAIAPGSVLSGAGVQESGDLDPDLYARVMRETALGYFAPPEEIASVALFLASDDASYVTGATILANGGWCTA